MAMPTVSQGSGGPVRFYRKREGRAHNPHRRVFGRMREKGF